MHPRASYLAWSSICLGAVAAHAAPVDPFAAAIPARDTKGPDEAAVPGTGDVDGTTGSATYVLPLAVPPGRSKLEPALALTYASTGALRGGIAVGWSLAVPSIELDPDVPSGGAYRANVDGSHRLIENTVDPGAGRRFRAERDASFAHYGLSTDGQRWTMTTLDGLKYTFAAQVQTSRWHLTSVQDGQGNRMTYEWALVQSAAGHEEQVLQAIEYTSNVLGAIEPHARVELIYAPLDTCANGAIAGAAIDRRFGRRRMTGSHRLDAIAMGVRDEVGGPWRTARRYDLRYDQAELGCGASGLRYLEEIAETGFAPDGTPTAAPVVQLSYGPTQRDLTVELTSPDVGGERGHAWGTTQTWMDFDGDGWLDDVRVEQGADCTLVVRPGRGLLWFAPAAEARRYPLPSAAWLDDAPEPSPGEGCTLSGQVVRRAQENYAGGQCRRRSVAVSYHLVDWDGDGRVDVLSELFESSPGLARGDFAPGFTFLDPFGTVTCAPGGGPEGEDACVCAAGEHPTEGSCGLCPNGTEWNPFFRSCQPVCNGPCPNDLPTGDVPESPGGAACVTPAPVPERTEPDNASGGFVLRLQRHTDTGLAAAVVVSAPLPLPPNPTSVTPLATPVIPELPPLVDVTGDGYLDLVSLHADPTLVNLPERRLGTATTLYVWPGRGDTGFDPRLAWSLPTWTPTWQIGTWSPLLGHFVAPDALRVLDWNGDGLPDLVAQLEPGAQLAVAFNTGAGFAPMQLLGVTGPAEEDRTEPGVFTSGPPPYLWSGARGTLRALADLDADGLPEQFTEIQPDNRSVAAVANLRRARRFFGDTLQATADLEPVWEAVEERVAAAAGTWYRASQLIDVTGDGLPDAVEWIEPVGAPRRIRVRTDHLSAQPPLRLLAEVRNGRGGSTRFTYRASTDPSVVHLNGRHLRPRMVVASVVRDAGWGPPMTTAYRYATPTHGHDGPLDRGPAHFAGFAEVTTSRSGALGADSSLTIQRYTFAPHGRDWTGKLAQEVVLEKLASGGHAPVTITSHTWINEGDVANFTHAAQQTRRTCAANATEATCTSAPASTLTTAQVWAPLAAIGGPAAAVYVNTETQVWPDGAAARRYRATSYELRSHWLFGSPQLFALSREQGERLGPVRTTLARTDTAYDARGLPVLTTEHVDAGRVAETRRGFTVTGQVAWTELPNQVALGSGVRTLVTYDERELYPAATMNELRQITLTQVDLGTGARRAQEGPQLHTVCGSQGCQPVAERTEWDLDGFGRVIEERVRTETDLDGGYAMRTVATTAYDDLALPNRVTRTAVQDHDAGTFVRRDAFHDGLGRVIREVTWRQLGGEPDAEVRYDHDAGGALAARHVPDPRGGKNGAAVTYRWIRDGVGRVASTWRPDGGGEDLHRDGLTTTVIERSPLATTTHLVDDAFGQLVRVIEVQAGGDAVTEYDHDAAGRRVLVRDADGLKTTFRHDLRGARTEVGRGDRVWRYEHDLEGHTTAVVQPMPAGADPADYTTRTTYDVLGRVVTRVPASLGRSAAARHDLGIGPEVHTYDGLRETAVELPFGRVDLRHDLRGRVIQERQRLQVPGTAVVTDQQVDLAYDATGALRRKQWDDGTQWRYDHDATGQVREVAWLAPGAPSWRSLARYRRNVAGAPIERTDDFGQARVQKYAELGRPSYERVFRPGDGHTYAERTYGYDGDEVALVWGHVLDKAADASYVYDERHRLVSAVGPASYAAQLTYGKTGNVLDAQIAGAADTPDRHVAYQYAATEPQAVARLRDVDTGVDVAVLDYDPSGNLTTRITPHGTSAFAWDADGQVREVDGPGGLERYFFGRKGERLAAVGPGGVRVWFGDSETHLTTAGATLVRRLHVAAGEAIARIEDGHDVELQYADALHNLMFTVDAQGTPSSAFLYGAFGELVEGLGAARHDRQFNGKVNDAASGLRHYGHRAYDPLLLRWTSADPLYRVAPDHAAAEPQRANLYAFALNNPVRWYDPDGLDGEDRHRRMVVYTDDDGAWRARWGDHNIDIGPVESTAAWVEAVLAEAAKQGGFIDELVVLGHGAAGDQRLNGTVSLMSRDPALAKLQGKVGTLWLLGCHVGLGAKGEAYLQRLSNATGARVAAYTGFSSPGELRGNGILAMRFPGLPVSSKDVIARQIVEHIDHGESHFSGQFGESKADLVGALWREAVDSGEARAVEARLTLPQRVVLHALIGAPTCQGTCPP